MFACAGVGAIVLRAPDTSKSAYRRASVRNARFVCVRLGIESSGKAVDSRILDKVASTAKYHARRLCRYRAGASI